MRRKKADDPKAPPILPLPQLSIKAVERKIRMLELIRKRIRAEMVKRILEMDAKCEKNYIV